MDPVTSTEWGKISLPHAIFFSKNEGTSLTSGSSNLSTENLCCTT